MNYLYEIIFEFNGSIDSISECLTEILAINNKQESWEELGINLKSVEDILYPIEALEPNLIKIRAANYPCGCLFEELCEKYNLYGTMKFKELKSNKTGTFIITSTGKKYKSAEINYICSESGGSSIEIEIF